MFAFLVRAATTRGQWPYRRVGRRNNELWSKLSLLYLRKSSSQGSHPATLVTTIVIVWSTNSMIFMDTHKTFNWLVGISFRAERSPNGLRGQILPRRALIDFGFVDFSLPITYVTMLFLPVNGCISIKFPIPLLLLFLKPRQGELLTSGALRARS